MSAASASSLADLTWPETACRAGDVLVVTVLAVALDDLCTLVAAWPAG